MTQDFTLDEKYFYLGASLNFQVAPRIPVTVRYEYIDLADSQFSRKPAVVPSQLPGFLSSGGGITESGNHTLQGRISYWISPMLNFSISGNLFSNQFLGKIPHYNNPLSESFASAAYGYIGAELGMRF